MVENLVFILVEQERALPENDIWENETPQALLLAKFWGVKVNSKG